MNKPRKINDKLEDVIFPNRHARKVFTEESGRGRTLIEQKMQSKNFVRFSCELLVISFQNIMLKMTVYVYMIDMQTCTQRHKKNTTQC